MTNIEINNIYNMDCLDLMKQMPDKSIDLVLTDPPYGIGASNYKRGGTQCRSQKTKTKVYAKKSWDDKTPSKEIFDEIFRVSKNQIIFGGNYFIENLKNSNCWLVWDKNNQGMNYADCELAWTSFKTSVRKFEYTWQGFRQGDMKNKEERIHPTQKPLPLFEWIIRKYSEEGDLILDPFSGSGTTALACHRLKRNFICVELDQEYFQSSEERLKKEKAQTNIFDFI